MWTCPRPASGGPAASRCASRSQTLSRISAHQMGTNAHRCSRCSSGCPVGCTDSSLTRSPECWCGTWHQTAHRHWREHNMKLGFKKGALSESALHNNSQSMKAGFMMMQRDRATIQVWAHFLILWSIQGLLKSPERAFQVIFQTKRSSISSPEEFTNAP